MTSSTGSLPLNTLLANLPDETWDRVRHRPLADSWAVYDNSGRAPRLLEKSL